MHILSPLVFSKYLEYTKKVFMWPLGKLEKTSRMWEEYDHIPNSVNGVCVCVFLDVQT